MLVEPNAFTTVPSGVRLWIDGRTPAPDALTAWRDALAARAAELARRHGRGDRARTASHTEGVAFDPGVLAALGDLPALVCFAGHDAGILAQRIPAGHGLRPQRRPASATRPRSTSSSTTRPSPPPPSLTALEALA